jgi:hypothetical protein
VLVNCSGELLESHALLGMAMALEFHVYAAQQILSGVVDPDAFSTNGTTDSLSRQMTVTRNRSSFRVSP